MKHRFINIRNVNMVIAREQSVMIVFCSTHYFNIFQSLYNAHACFCVCYPRILVNVLDGPFMFLYPDFKLARKSLLLNNGKRL